MGSKPWQIGTPEENRFILSFIRIFFPQVLKNVQKIVPSPTNLSSNLSSTPIPPESKFEGQKTWVSIYVSCKWWHTVCSQGKFMGCPDLSSRILFLHWDTYFSNTWVYIQVYPGLSKFIQVYPGLSWFINCLSSIVSSLDSKDMSGPHHAPLPGLSWWIAKIFRVHGPGYNVPKRWDGAGRSGHVVCHKPSTGDLSMSYPF